MDNEDDAGTNGARELLELHDGDVLRFPPVIYPDSRGGPPMTFIGEIEIATGSRGETLARAQAQAFYEIALYQAEMRTQEQSQASTNDRAAETEGSGSASTSE